MFDEWLHEAMSTSSSPRQVNNQRQRAPPILPATDAEVILDEGKVTAPHFDEEHETAFQIARGAIEEIVGHPSIDYTDIDTFTTVFAMAASGLPQYRWFFGHLSMLEEFFDIQSEGKDNGAPFAPQRVPEVQRSGRQILYRGLSSAIAHFYARDDRIEESDHVSSDAASVEMSLEE